MVSCFDMDAKNLLVVIPHASIDKPKEIEETWLSEHQKQLLFTETAETDRGTDQLYDFRNILHNKQLVFPISQIYINICRHPDNLAEAVPLHIRELPVYKPGSEPNVELREKLISEYSYPFIEEIKSTKKTLLLNGHSMVAGHSSLGNEDLSDDIVLSDWLKYNGQVIRFAPKEIIDFYAQEIKQRLPKLKIGRNSVYTATYDHVCATFGWDGISQHDESRIPVIHQETNEALYLEGDTVIPEKITVLKRAFTEAILETMKHFDLQ